MLNISNNRNNKPQAGEIWWAEIPNAIGHQQGGKHPVLIYSNNIFNKFADIVDVYPLTSQTQKYSPVHVFVKKDHLNHLEKDSAIQIENPWHINKFQLVEKIGVISVDDQREVVEKIMKQCPMFNLLQIVKA